MSQPKGDRVLNEAERNLVAVIGVYGIWLLRNKRALPADHETVAKLKSEYQTWQQGGGDVGKAGGLLDAVDAVIAAGFGGPLAKSYDEGLKALIQWRKERQGAINGG